MSDNRTQDNGTGNISVESLLSPLDRVSEVVFGVLMTLTFTSAVAVAEAGDGGLRSLASSALGCNLAWGIVDGAMFVFRRLADQARKRRVIEELRNASSDELFVERLQAELPGPVAKALATADLARTRRLLHETPVPAKAQVHPAELLSAVFICALVFISTFPIIVPLILVKEPWLALRLSHLTAVVMLAFLGWYLGRWTVQPPWASALVMAVVGAVLALICIALGG